MTDALPIAAAAVVIGEKPATLARWIRDHNAPVVVRGRKGRGCATLVDPAAIATWRRSQLAERQTLELAGVIPELVADAVYETFTAANGPQKRGLALPLATAWYLTVNALLDHLRIRCPEIAEIQQMPEKIEALRCIFDDTSTLDVNQRRNR